MTEFKAGEFYKVDWSNEDIFCSSHSNGRNVVFIREYGTRAMVAYAHEHGGICVGLVPYSALSKE